MPSPQPPTKARPVKLHAGLTLEQGFALIARNCLRQMRANEAGLRLSDEPEFVHQMRVGLRRLRSALGLFKPWITLAPALLGELAWLGQTLGAARDAEVLAGATLPTLIRAGAELEGLGGLQQAATSLAQRRRRQAVLALNSERYLGLMAGLADWLKARGWRTDSPCPDELGGPLQAAGQQMLKRRRKQMRQHLLGLPEPASADDRHRLRIAVKKLRYADEFFRTLLAQPDEARRYPITALQELLGQLNDAEVGRGLLLDLGNKAHAGPAAFARGALWAQSQQRIVELAALLRALEPGNNRRL